MACMGQYKAMTTSLANSEFLLPRLVVKLIALTVLLRNTYIVFRRFNLVILQSFILCKFLRSME